MSSSAVVKAPPPLEATPEEIAQAEVAMAVGARAGLGAGQVEGDVLSPRLAEVLPSIPSGHPALWLHGRLEQGGIVVGKVTRPVQSIHLGKKRIRVAKDGRFLFGFGRDEAAKRVLSIVFQGNDSREAESAPSAGQRAVAALAAERASAEGSATGNQGTQVSAGDEGDAGLTHSIALHVAAREYDVSPVNELDEEDINLDRKTKRSLAKSNAEIRRIRSAYRDSAAFEDGFEWPLQGPITDTYGTKRSVDGKPAGYHFGVDIARPVGKVVKAPGAGKVVYARNDVPLAGNLLIIDHGQGLTSSFLHLSRFEVGEGDTVRAGQPIARVGRTGRVTGAHLDWRMNLHGTRIDPAMLVGPMVWINKKAL